MTGRVKITAHPRDPAIRLVQHRRSATDTTVEAEITLPGGGRKIVSTKCHDVGMAAFAAVDIKARLLGMIEATGSAALRKAAVP